jgi:predicted nucleic acid-binding Zn ribbon protein
MGGSRFTPLGDVLAAYLDRSGMNERIEEAQVVPEWADRVGPAIAAITRPLSVSRGTLQVGVRSSAWMMELHMMEREIVRQLNAGREKALIRRVRFVMLDADNSGRGPGYNRG